MSRQPVRAKIKKALVAAVEADLLKRLRDHGPVSRIDLARQMKLAPSTIGIYVRRLIGDGYLTEGKQVTRDLGRPAVMLSLNPAGGSFVGIDIEARNIYAVSIDFAQQTLKRLHVELRPAEATVANVFRRVEELVEEVRVADRRFLGLGLGVPGTVDPKRGIALHYEHIAGWNDVQVRDRLTARFGVPVHVENNIRSLAMAERWFGAGRGVGNYLCIGIRSGFGVGIVVDGRLCRGATNAAGEAGRWPTGDALAAKSNNGVESLRADGTLESHVAVSGLLKRYAAATGRDVPTFGEFAERISRRDARALELLREATSQLGRFLVQVNLLLNPQRIILAGRLPELGDVVLAPLREALEAAGPGSPGHKPELTVSELGEFGGALGAAALTVHEWKPAR
jgi:predicted NBD/HSP70 family sugar kinase